MDWGSTGLASREAPFPRDVGQERVLFRSGNTAAGRDWLGGRDLLIKPQVLGYGEANQLKLSWGATTGVC